jgi:hypothetical protein
MPFAADVTRVNPLAVVRRERLLPRSGEILVRRGQPVTPVQVIGRTTQAPRFTVLYGSRLLGIDAAEMNGHLQVQEGDTVEQGDVLLTRARRFGRRMLVRSPVDGTIAFIGIGRVVIQEPTVPYELRALIEAEVAQVVPGFGVVLETVGAHIQALWDSGRDGTGKLCMLAEQPEDRLEVEQIDSSHRGAILVAGSIAHQAVLEAAQNNGVRGLILGSLPLALLQLAAGQSYPVLVTDGIGAHQMATPVFDLLGQSIERKATLFARNPGRPYNRPEIVIPLPASAHAEELNEPGALQPGHSVRVTHPPYLGTVGRVVRTYELARSSDIGTRAPGADIALPDGQVAFVPYTNLDRII